MECKLITLLIITIWSSGSATAADPIVDTTLELSPDNNKEIDHRNDIIQSDPIANNVISVIPAQAATGNQFGLVLSKTFEPFGNLFFSVKKWEKNHLQQPQQFPQPLLEPQFQPQPFPHQPSLDLSIRAPALPNFQPLINAFPGVLVSGYKTLLDKIWPKKVVVWDAAINLPSFAFQNSGKFGSDVGSIHGTHQVVNGDISSLIDIRDTPQQVNWNRKRNENLA